MICFRYWRVVKARKLIIVSCGSGDNPSVLPEVSRRSMFNGLAATLPFDARRLSYMYRLFSGLIFVVLVAQLGCRGSDSRGPGVILMRYNPGSQSTEQREQGFLETLAKDFPQVKVISSDQ